MQKLQLETYREMKASLTPALASDYYVWSFPGSPVRIHLHLEVVERLLKKLVKSSSEAQKLESGGLLFGRAESPNQIEIRDVQPVGGGDRPGQSYVFSEEDCVQVELAKAAALSRADGLAVVGYYRSHTGDGLCLDNDDLAFFQKHFPERTNVALLVKPLEGGLSTAGFFFWDNGVVESGFTFNEFPFDPERLRLESIEQRLAALQLSATQQPAKAATSDDPDGAPAIKKSWRLLPAVVSLTSLSMLIIGYYLWTGGYSLKATDESEPEADNSALALRVQTQGGDLRVSWNRNAPALRGSVVSGLLTIVDGDLPKREIPLGPEELRMTANIIYSPVNKNVKFRLDLLGTGEAIAESVLTIKGSPNGAAAAKKEPSPKTALPQAAVPKAPAFPKTAPPAAPSSQAVSPQQ